MVTADSSNSNNDFTDLNSRRSVLSNDDVELNKNHIWKYYKLYDELNSNSSDLMIAADNYNSIIRQIKLTNTILYTRFSSNNAINIYDNNTQTLIVHDLAINDSDIESHTLVDILIVENVDEDSVYVVMVFEENNNDREVNSPYVIKVFNYRDILLSHVEKKNLKYHTMVTVNDTAGKNKYPVTRFIINNDLNIALLGLGNGSIYLIRGDLKRDRGYKQRLIYKSLSQQPITNLKFINNEVQVIVSTVDKVFILNTDGKIDNRTHLDKNYFKMICDNEGCSLNLLDSFGDENLYVLNENFINVYSFKSGYTKVDTIPLSLGYKGIEPVLLKCLNEKEILIVSKLGSSTSNEFNESFKLTVVDLQNRVTTLNAIYNNSVKDIIEITDQQSFQIILQNGKKYSYQLKQIKEIIKILLQSTSISDFEFNLAINILKEKNLNIDEVSKKYGDFLYSENRTSEAMQQYIHCIQYFMLNSEDNKDLYFDQDINNSLTITDIVIKFAMQKKETLLNDNENLNNLVKFLTELIKKDFGSKPAYTTLLMILFIKLNKWTDFINLVNIIDRKGLINETNVTTDDAHYNFSIEEDEDYWYSDLVVFDVELITDLLLDTIEHNNSEYFSEIKDLLFKITVKFCKDAEKIVSVLITNLGLYEFALNWIQRLDAAGLMNIIFGPLEIGRLLLDMDYTTNSDTDLVIDLYVGLFTGNYKTVNNHQQQVIQTYQTPKPSIIFNFFINHQRRFVLFLEQLLASGKVEDKTEYEHCVNALYSSYCNLNLSEKADSFYKKNKAIVSDLLLVDLHKQPEDPLSCLNFAIMSQNVSKIIEIENLNENTKLTKDMNIKILRFITSKQQFLSEYSDERLLSLIKSLLDNNHITMNGLVTILGESNVVKFGFIKQLLINWVTEQEDKIMKQKNQIELFEKESSKMKITSIVSNASAVCFTCQLPLDHEYYKFNCGHSVHKGCLNEARDVKCPSCGHSLEVLGPEINTFNEYAQVNDSEIGACLSSASQTEENPDFGFNILLDLIGKGALEIQ